MKSHHPQPHSGSTGYCIKCGDWRLIIDDAGHCFGCCVPAEKPGAREPGLVKENVAGLDYILPAGLTFDGEASC